MRSGDAQSIEIFVKKYYPLILKYCCLHICDHGYAEDMAQETFEQFFRTFDRYRHYGKALNYLYVIASSKCKNHQRKNVDLVFEKLPEQADGKTEYMEEWLDVRIAMNRLPPELRDPAILFYVQQLKQREIAEILGIGLPLVKYRIRKAKELLADYLKEE
ncbi:MAG: RNA polymerase sigma factor [Eubacteriales bacterium]|nr:RNA polymerase sigma factor [Eubacteriales bacterium]